MDNYNWIFTVLAVAAAGTFLSHKCVHAYDSKTFYFSSVPQI